MEKRGEISTTTVALVLLAIMGFAIVLYFLFSIDIQGLTKDDTCRLSVLARATLPSAAQSAIPLVCTTKKICITDSIFGGGCREQFAGESDIEIVRLTGKDVVEKRKMIEEISANAMYDCWNTMGQGKLDIFGNFYGSLKLTTKVPTCVICSRVAVDKSVEDKILYENGVGVNVNTFMATNKVPGKDITYLQAFSDKDVGAYSRVAADFAGDADKLMEYNYLTGEKELTDAEKQRLEDIKKQMAVTGADVNRQIAFVFAQIVNEKVGGSEDILKNIGAVGATVAGGAFIMPLVGGVGNFGSAIYLGTVGLVAGTALGTVQQIYGAWNVQESQITAMGYCGKFASTSDGAREGCSVVEAVNYKYQPINKICPRLQGSS